MDKRLAALRSLNVDVRRFRKDVQRLSDNTGNLQSEVAAVDKRRRVSFGLIALFLVLQLAMIALLASLAFDVRDIGRNNRSLLRGQRESIECIRALLLIPPEDRRLLHREFFDVICPPFPGIVMPPPLEEDDSTSTTPGVVPCRSDDNGVHGGGAGRQPPGSGEGATSEPSESTTTTTSTTSTTQPGPECLVRVDGVCLPHRDGVPPFPLAMGGGMAALVLLGHRRSGLLRRTASEECDEDSQEFAE